MVKKNQAGLTLGVMMTPPPSLGEVDNPPPQKIVGLKLCWVVVSCPKIFFSEKTGVWLTPGGCSRHTPENSKVKSVWLSLVLLGEAAYKISDP